VECVDCHNPHAARGEPPKSGSTLLGPTLAGMPGVDMSGADIKAILEDVSDNLFNEDPYYQQGGDMVRVGGLDYVCDPNQGFGKRISDMTLDDGTKVEAEKKYMVAGWATVGSQSPGRPIWDVVADYLRDRKTIKIEKLNTPRLVGVESNPGISG